MNIYINLHAKTQGIWYYWTENGIATSLRNDFTCVLIMFNFIGLDNQIRMESGILENNQYFSSLRSVSICK